MRRALLAVIAALLVLPQSAHADTDQLPNLAPAQARTLVVDAKRGRDRNPGTARRPLRTVGAAWERIPQGRTLKRPVRILVRPGRYGGEGAAELLGAALGDGAGPDRPRRRAPREGDLRRGEPVRPALGGLRRHHLLRPQRPLPLRALPARPAHALAPDGLAGPAARERQDQSVPAHRHHRQRDLGRRGQRDRLRRGPVRADHRQRDRARQRLVRLREGRLGVRARGPQPHPPLRDRRLHRRAGHRAAVHDRALHPLRGLRDRRPRQHDHRTSRAPGSASTAATTSSSPATTSGTSGGGRTGSRSGTARARATADPATRAASAANRTSTPAAGAPRASTTGPTTCGSRTATSGCSATSSTTRRPRAISSSASPRPSTAPEQAGSGPGRR